MLFSLYTNHCTSSHDSVKLIKFADDTTLIGLISNNDESAYRREVDRLVSWCSGNNLELNAQKTVEMIVDFRKSTVPPPPPSVMDSPITSVESFRFLGTTITQDLKWEPTISSLIKKAQQRRYFLRQLRKAKLPAQMLVQFYTAIIESILTSSRSSPMGPSLRGGPPPVDPSRALVCRLEVSPQAAAVHRSGPGLSCPTGSWGLLGVYLSASAVRL
uniref:Reverse transcriptase domain-containing protein n=1 Tax=Knipowitschia caucasica TaxID=637954 RepID=A0AAV2KXX2_KNICA